MDRQLRKNILQTLIYSDIFRFPLTKDEIWKYLIGKSVSKRLFQRQLYLLPESYHTNEWFHLPEKEDYIRDRKEKFAWNNEKIKRAKFFSNVLSIIPTIAFIGISGSVAAYNANKEDDIDLFFITFKNTLWLTRLSIVAMLAILKVGRRKNEKKIADKICTNFFIDEENLEIMDKNIYSAHEVALLKPLFQRDDMYSKFITSNFWVKDILPNSIKNSKKSMFPYIIKYLFVLLYPLEKLSYYFQIKYMKQEKTTVNIGQGIAFFYPLDFGNKIMRIFERKKKIYGI